LLDLLKYILYLLLSQLSNFWGAVQEERSKVLEALRRFADVEPRMAEVLRSLGMIPPS